MINTCFSSDPMGKIVAYRNEGRQQPNHFPKYVVKLIASEVGFAAVTIAALVETVVYAIFSAVAFLALKAGVQGQNRPFEYLKSSSSIVCLGLVNLASNPFPGLLRMPLSQPQLIQNNRVSVQQQPIIAQTPRQPMTAPSRVEVQPTRPPENTCPTISITVPPSTPSAPPAPIRIPQPVNQWVSLYQEISRDADALNGASHPLVKLDFNKISDEVERAVQEANYDRVVAEGGNLIYTIIDSLNGSCRQEAIGLLQDYDPALFNYVAIKSFYYYTFGRRSYYAIPEFFTPQTKIALEKLRNKFPTMIDFSLQQAVDTLVIVSDEIDGDAPKRCLDTDDSKGLYRILHDLLIGYERQGGFFEIKCWEYAIKRFAAE